MAQKGSVEILPEAGSNSSKTGSQSNHKITVKTESENYGFLQKTDQLGVGTFISNTNGGYASYSTSGLNTMTFTTNAQNPQVTLNILNFMGIGGQPLNALHVYGGTQISELANTNSYAQNPPIKVDDAGKLTSELKTYYYSIPRSAFTPILGAYDENPIAESALGGIYFTLSGQFIDKFEAPVFLPSGAIITGMEIYYIDNSSADINASLSYKVSDLKYPTLVDPKLNSTGAAPGIRSMSTYSINNNIGMPFLDNASYYIIINSLDNVSGKKWDGPDTQIVAAKIIYKY
jgi:hypothetical protein